MQLSNPRERVARACGVLIRDYIVEWTPPPPTSTPSPGAAARFRLQQAELQTLKTQLWPHFLFNTLNAISALVYSSPKRADLTITHLSDLLRASLKNTRQEEIPLREEVEFLKNYLFIHQTLMEDRLDLDWQVDPDTLDAAVPNMLLQPLVENAIRHGLEPLERGGAIKILVYRREGTLVLRVEDNGVGLPEGDAAEGSGIGLSNTRARLYHLYGDAHSFELRGIDGGGVSVEIGIPYRELRSEDRNEH